MKRLLAFLGFCLPLLSQQTGLIPDCVIGPVTLTTAARFPSGGYANQAGCIYWTLAYKSHGFTVISIELDSAEDSASGTPGTWAAFNGTALLSTTTPMTSLTGSYYIGSAAIAGYVPWLSIELTTATGTGSVQAYAYGYRSNAGSAGGGGGSSNVNIADVGGAATPALNGGLATWSGCGSKVEQALSSTSYTSIVAGSGTKVIHVCNVAYSSAASNVPVVNTFALAFGTCASSPTQILSLPGITGYVDNFYGSLAGAAGAALCASESVAESDNVTVTYSQY
jgi:hypothetical protein